jgi:hypothetical protein
MPVECIEQLPAADLERWMDMYQAQEQESLQAQLD